MAQTRRPSQDSLGRLPGDSASHRWDGDRWDGRGQATGAAGPPALLAERFRNALSVRRLLWVSLVLIPVDLLAHILGMRGVPLFVLSVVVLLPLAWLIGEATEQTGEYTGPAIAGLLNASFGNAPELLIALFAVSHGLFDVVRGSLSGSVISNLLLVLGSALLIGGKGQIGRRTTYSALGMVAMATVLFVLPSIARTGIGDKAALYAVGVPVAVVLAAVYLVVIVRSVRREHREHRENGKPGNPDWSLPRSLVTLALATLATAAVAELLIGSIQEFARAAGLSQMFVAAVIVAIAGNAAEHGGAVMIASRGGIRLASEIALQSASQVAVGLIPAVALLSLAIRPFPLAFSAVEFLGLGIAVAVPAVLLARGRSARWHGPVLLAAYAVIIAAFYVAT
jgi:Ca2+:H+ antiporter